MKNIRLWVEKHFEDLLEIDLRLARIIGAPTPYTLSAWAYKRELDGSTRAKFWRKFIDFWYGRLIMGQENHCKTDFLRVNKKES